MKRISIHDLVGNTVMGVGVSENLAWTAVQSIGVGIEHALAHRGITGKADVRMTGAFLLPNLTRESLVTMVIAGSGLNRVQAEQAVQSVQNCLIQALNEDADVEVQNLGLFHAVPGTTVVNPDSPLIFEPFVSPGIP